MVMVLPAAGATIFSENFSENFNSATVGVKNVGAIAGTQFSVGSGSVDMFGTGFGAFLCVGFSSGNCVDLNGDAAGTLSTTSPIVLAAGNYVLTFTLNGSQRGVATSTTVSPGSLFTQTFAENSDDLNVFAINFSVASSTSATLTFTSNTSGARGVVGQHLAGHIRGSRADDVHIDWRRPPSHRAPGA
jgi:hypothetical protein